MLNVIFSSTNSKYVSVIFKIQGEVITIFQLLRESRNVYVQYDTYSIRLKDLNFLLIYYTFTISE